MEQPLLRPRELSGGASVVHRIPRRGARSGVRRAVAPYDAIVVIGAPVFTFHVEGTCNLFTIGVPLYQITSDPEAAASAPAGHAAIGSVRLGLMQLLAQLPERIERERPPPRKRKPPVEPRDPIPAEYLMLAIDRARPQDAIVVEEAPSHRPVMQHYLPMRSDGAFSQW